MKKVFTLAFLTIAQFSFSQNLVPNPSFEDTVSCPDGFDEMDRSFGWSSFRASPDYFNACANSTYGVPENQWGYQSAFSGVAYAVIATYDAQHLPTVYREFIGTQLTQSLIPGTKYFASAFISRCDSSYTNGATNKFGFRFSTIPYSAFDPTPIDNFSHIHSDSIITDKINWTRISGSFIADSSYQYLIIGNFYDNQHTDTFEISNNSAGYYVDAVCVSMDSLYNLNWTGFLEPVFKSKQPIIFPNPVRNVLHFKNISHVAKYYLENEFGQILKEGFLSSNENNIDISAFSNGIYFLSIEEKYFYKVIISH